VYDPHPHARGPVGGGNQHLQGPKEASSKQRRHAYADSDWDKSLSCPP
jgi:hypothetical protein